MSLAPLQLVNDTKINTRSDVVNTPTKKNYIPISFEKENNNPSFVCQKGKKSNHNDGENNGNAQQHARHHSPVHKKKKEKLSSLCKTPPSLIKSKGKDYYRGHFLGEGGFARCFQMKDDDGKVFAAKTVAKISIKSEKARNKLLSEIQIHKNMRHQNIVHFIDCFEDDINVYILLEICPNGSLMDLLKRRKILTEPEVRFFTTQICGALDHMHSRNIIHRDLKLGNIFFDKDFNLKIGDFGLAAIINNENERKYTICGTPNYIAPEVIMGGKQIGHSFEVDIWSLGVMIFAMITGKPPFQAKEVSTIYDRIKHCNYSFPTDKYVSKDVKKLIQDILSMNPMERPTIQEILNYNWFKGNFPPCMPIDVMNDIPIYFMDISPEESLINFRNCMIRSGLLVDEEENVEDDSPIQNYQYKLIKDNLSSITSKLFSKEQQQQKLLPNNLSPGHTKQKYKEITRKISKQNLNKIGCDFKDSILDISKNVSPITNNFQGTNSANYITSRMSAKILANECYITLKNILEIENQIERTKNISDLEIFPVLQIKDPIIVTKWVDYTNRHGFAYQLSTEDIGVLFNNGVTVLKLSDVEEFWHIENDDLQGWIAIHLKISEKPELLNKYFSVLDFFSKYMKNNLNRVSSFIKRDYHKDDVFLRRYTRCNEFIMFELSDGTFQFNFKDHYKIVLSNSGKLVSLISPNQESTTLPLIEILKGQKIENFTNCDIMNKFQLMKQLLNQKSVGVIKR
ncbi:hypothetical protein Kpol_1023p26 [Vanderwaltozyma polyspora DSM 70294]|uniref:Serine/threonine-protein kinase n=1 Tax=Vanderwaltozyma polyspora (strain ATCC 22028 / DSM 70294 / BCRC 21397 / CBS 2163 / NBRC 10782 / NRRL Y-8283 / UCD 57-17) TaxID=436907 RepID=A7TFP9_VANPO|nr:uncharacterized protein Kpol_1023p26 [Vanderwaltozyma polyspora DSM 70294]EDO18857.1 hypothetical protein Kpol_1023p26 [Vanderwaltozyma polyspora DSM 70294]